MRALVFSPHCVTKHATWFCYHIAIIFMLYALVHSVNQCWYLFLWTDAIININYCCCCCCLLLSQNRMSCSFVFVSLLLFFFGKRERERKRGELRMHILTPGFRLIIAVYCLQTCTTHCDKNQCVLAAFKYTHTHNVITR